MDTGNKAGAKSSVPQIASAAIFYITDTGYELARRIQALYPGSRIMKFTSAGAMHELPLIWNERKNIIFIMAAGIAVRSIASLLKNKRTDPAVVVLDENGEFVVSLLSGHIGGANALAKEIADYLGARAVITTASDVQGRVSLDLWAAEKNLFVEDAGKLTQISARIVNNRAVRVFSDLTLKPETVPGEFTIVDAAEEADVIISGRLLESDALFLRPRNLVAGIGCNRGTSKEEIASVVTDVMLDKKLSHHSIQGVASIDLKQDEKGLLEYAQDNTLNIAFYSADELNHTASNHKLARSETVMTATGAVAVAEPAALMGARAVSGDYSLIVTKQKRGNVTLAIAKAEFIL